jgi:hypothetical protein
MDKYQVDRVRWARMSLFEQLGNIGSEVGRTAKEFTKNDQDGFKAALTRALDLFDATTEQLIKEKSHRVKEVLRSRDQFLTQYYQDVPRVDASLETYFMNFALTARMHK